MTSPDRSKGDRSRDEVLAGEYVLGVLSSDDRRKVEARMQRDHDFAAIVYRWQENLSSFNDEYSPEQPPAWIYPRIEKRVYGTPAKQAAAVPASGGIWNSLIFWRSLTVASLAAVAGLVIVNSGLLAPVPPASRQLVAEMSGENNAVSLVARYDEASGRLRMTPVAAGKPEEKSLELWLIKGSDPAKSLGVLPQTGEGELVIPANLKSLFGEGVTLAVSVEPFGGSPTGQATGPVIAVGSARTP